MTNDEEYTSITRTVFVHLTPACAEAASAGRPACTATLFLTRVPAGRLATLVRTSKGVHPSP
jgi:hypothetical protein